MDKNVDRRDFAKRTSLAVGGLLAGTLLGGARAAAGDDEEPDHRLLLLGLNALARAHTMNYFADGHRGASMIAAHQLCVENKLDKPTRARIVELFDLNWAPSPLCKPFPEAEPDPAGIAKIGAALAEGAEVLRQVGHNAIFAMLAIKGFRLVPSAATPERVDGVCKLIRSFTPWQDIEPDPKVSPPPFTDAAAASRFILAEASAAIDRFIDFGQGFAGHMFTFGQSLVELAAMGDLKLADSCRTAFRKYVTVTRQGPPADAKRYTEKKPTDLRPTDLAYWKQRGDHTLGIGHVFKYPYSYYNLKHRAGDCDVTRELEAKVYRVI